jgi:hypothetical protein
VGGIEQRIEETALDLALLLERHVRDASLLGRPSSR